jgi:hypothetical protein
MVGNTETYVYVHVFRKRRGWCKFFGTLEGEHETAIKENAEKRKAMMDLERLVQFKLIP